MCDRRYVSGPEGNTGVSPLRHRCAMTSVEITVLGGWSMTVLVVWCMTVSAVRSMTVLVGRIHEMKERSQSSVVLVSS